MTIQYTPTLKKDSSGKLFNTYHTQLINESHLALGFYLVHTSFIIYYGDNNRLICGILNNNKNEVLVGSDHYFMFLGAYSQECHIIGWIQISNYTAGFVGQLTHQTRVLNRRRIVKRRLHWNT